MHDSDANRDAGQMDELILSARSGNPEAQSTLFKLVAPKIARYLARRFSGIQAADIDDAAQAVLIKVMSPTTKFEPKQRAWAWIIQIASREYLNIRRQRLTPRPPPDRPVDDDGFEKEDWAARFEKVMESAIQSLTPRQIQAVSLRISSLNNSGEPLTFKEIAKVMDCSTENVKDLLGRARTGIVDYFVTHAPDYYEAHRIYFERYIEGGEE